MFSSQSAEYQICLPSRHISSLPADTKQHRFIVGTCFIPGSIENDPNNAITGNDGNNELHLLRFHEELNELMVDIILDHPTGEVWNLKPSLVDKNLVLTCGGNGTTVLWRIPGVLPDGDEYQEEDINAVLESPRTPMEETARLPLENKRLDSAIWNPEPGAGLDLVTLHRDGGEQILSRWNLDNSEPATTLAKSTVLFHDATYAPSSAVWDPHSPSVVAYTRSRGVTLHDLRAPASEATRLPFLHRYNVTSLDYNPNRPGIMITGGDDTLLKFWDVRVHSSSRAIRPIKICRGGHTHSLTQVKYNPFHDQLILSGGSDDRVNLWRVSSISSAPLLELSSEENEEDDGPDVRVSKTENQESVYGVSWSACDAWCYGMVSFDGQVVLNHVPSKEKYKILL